jgi:exosortase A-associated hydrolase 2
VIYVHPFVEEINKSRRMAALQSRALANCGFSVLQIDLYGCADSTGDFADARWQIWTEDVMHGYHWLRSRVRVNSGTGASMPLWLWGLRAGCLLAVQAAERIDEPCNFLFWAPITSGQAQLQQCLRIKLAGGMLDGLPNGNMRSMQEDLAHGNSIEVAGYRLNGDLAKSLAQAVLSPPDCIDTSQRMEWFDLSTREESGVGRQCARTIDQWQHAGYAARAQQLIGPAFWQTSEIETAPALINATCAALCGIAT